MAKRNHGKYVRQTQGVVTATSTLVDIVIPVFNRFDLLGKCLEALPAAFSKHRYTVTLVDNGSDKVEADAFYASTVMAKIVRGKNNVGFPLACNFGAKQFRSPMIFFLNSDVIMDPGSGDLIVDKMLSDPQNGVIGMKLVFPEDCGDLDPAVRPAGRIQHIGLSVDIHSNVHHPFISWTETHPRIMRQDDMFAVTGAALLVRRELWNKVGGFYEGYGRGTYEDVDLCCSVRALGYNIKVVPQARGIHYVGATAEKYRLPYDLQQNRAIFLSRHRNNLVWWDGIIL